MENAITTTRDNFLCRKLNYISSVKFQLSEYQCGSFQHKGFRVSESIHFAFKVLIKYSNRTYTWNLNIS